MEDLDDCGKLLLRYRIPMVMQVPHVPMSHIRTKVWIEIHFQARMEMSSNLMRISRPGILSGTHITCLSACFLRNFVGTSDDWGVVVAV